MQPSYFRRQILHRVRLSVRGFQRCWRFWRIFRIFSVNFTGNLRMFQDRDWKHGILKLSSRDFASSGLFFDARVWESLTLFTNFWKVCNKIYYVRLFSLETAFNLFYREITFENYWQFEANSIKNGSNIGNLESSSYDFSWNLFFRSTSFNCWHFRWIFDFEEALRL